jgi:hypothetical protein
MVSKGVFYGVVILLVALLIVSASAAAVYYGQYQSAATDNQRYVGELETALASYRSLSGSFNSSLGDYNRTLSLLATAVASLNTSTPAYQNASLALSSLWSSYQELASANGRKALVYGVNMLLNFGNGTRRWYNDSAAQPGWDGYVTTLVLLKGDVQAVWYPAGSFGPGTQGEHFVTGLDGVSQTSSVYWGVWQLSGGSWSYSQTGADLMEMHNGTTFAWALCSLDADYMPTCTP